MFPVLYPLPCTFARDHTLAVNCLVLLLGPDFKSKYEENGAGFCGIFSPYLMAQEAQGNQTESVLMFSQKHTLIYIHLLALQWHF